MNNNQIPKINQLFQNYFSMPNIPNHSPQFISQQNLIPQLLPISPNLYSSFNDQNPLPNINQPNTLQKLLQNPLNEKNELMIAQILLNENFINNYKQLNEEINNDKKKKK